MALHAQVHLITHVAALERRLAPSAATGSGQKPVRFMTRETATRQLNIAVRLSVLLWCLCLCPTRAAAVVYTMAARLQGGRTTTGLFANTVCCPAQQSICFEGHTFAHKQAPQVAGCFENNYHYISLAASSLLLMDSTSTTRLPAEKNDGAPSAGCGVNSTVPGHGSAGRGPHAAQPLHRPPTRRALHSGGLCHVLSLYAESRLAELSIHVGCTMFSSSLLTRFSQSFSSRWAAVASGKHANLLIQW